MGHVHVRVRFEFEFSEENSARFGEEQNDQRDEPKDKTTHLQNSTQP